MVGRDDVGGGSLYAVLLTRKQARYISDVLFYGIRHSPSNRGMTNFNPHYIFLCGWNKLTLSRPNYELHMDCRSADNGRRRDISLCWILR